MLKGIKNYLPALKQFHQRQLSHNHTSLFAASANQGTSIKYAAGQHQELQNNRFQLNDNYEGFTCTKAQYIPDFNMTAYLFKHDRIGAEYLHIDRNDPNNVFSIIFRTPPYDSTGLPHILEHLTLCGSKKYPVRDPFFKMINRSVATFMNAMTGPDYTMYPFSSMNYVDFMNLQQIYLDAIFRPNLHYHDFLQEGWRLEKNNNSNDNNSDYTIKGVVYNEMKGAMSDITSYFSTKYLNRILPSNTYGHCSGGDPLVIPLLKYQDLVEFHQKYYHPSNARFFSYGNFNPIPSMRNINSEYLSNVSGIDASFGNVPPQQRWTQPISDAITFRFDNLGAPIEKQHQIAIGYLMSDITNVYETLVLNVLSELLVKGPNSIFYKNLIEPNISGGYSSATGFENSIRDTMFVVGLQDVDEKDFGRIEDIFDRTIDEVISCGFDAEHIESILNNFELALKHQEPKFGLGIMFTVSPIWNHGGDPIESLQFSTHLSKLRENLKQNPKYLQDKMKQYFQDNKHRLLLTMSPDAEYETKFSDKEKQLIESKTKSLTPDAKKQILDDAAILEKNQKSIQNHDILPCLSLEEVEQPPASYNLDVTRIAGIPTQICAIDTNNVSYANIIYNAAELTTNQKHLLPILTHIIDQMGTKTLDYRTLDKKIKLHTSGIGFDVHFAEHFNDLSKYQVGVQIHSHCLEQNIGKMFELINDLVKRFNFDDVDRFNMLLQNYQSALNVGILQSGHRYAMQSSAGLINDAQSMKTRLGGIEHLSYVKELIESTPNEVILQQLKDIAVTLFGRGSVRCALNTSEQIRDQFVKKYSEFLKNTTMRDHSQQHRWENSNQLANITNMHNVMTIPVNYCAKSILAVPYDHPDYAALRILGKILSAKYLLPIVREQNGAYGTGAHISNNGMFSFFSYRDPNTIKTLTTFDESGKWIIDNWKIIDHQVLFEAKLGVLQSIDAPIAPGSKGRDYFIYGISQNMAAEHRRRILSVKHEDLERVNELYLKNSNLPSSKFVLGPENETFRNENWSIKQV